MHKYLEQQMGLSIQKDATQLQIRTPWTIRRRWLNRKDVSFKDGTLRPNMLFNQLVQSGSRWDEGNPGGTAEKI
jgi:hypothetical protein